MTNEELERIMNYIIERQETFADQMVQSNVRMTRLEAAMTEQQAAMTQQQASMAQQQATMAQQQATMAHQQQIGAQQQAAIFAMIEAQQHASNDVSNLARVVDHLVETVSVLLDRTAGGNGNGNKPDANTTR
jgi:predicted  nucleic acid-binding Zn-ribbon protein